MDIDSIFKVLAGTLSTKMDLIFHMAGEIILPCNLLTNV